MLDVAAAEARKRGEREHSDARPIQTDGADKRAYVSTNSIVSEQARRRFTKTSRTNADLIR